MGGRGRRQCSRHGRTAASSPGGRGERRCWVRDRDPIDQIDTWRIGHLTIVPFPRKTGALLLLGPGVRLAGAEEELDLKAQVADLSKQVRATVERVRCDDGD